MATSLPRIVGEFDALENIAWVVAAYSFATGIAMPIYGRLTDKLGSSKVFVIAVTTFLVGSTLCGLAADIWMLSASRVIQGLGGAGLTLLPYAILSTLVPERSRPKYMAPLAAVWSVAAISGPIVGGILTDTLGWRWIFWINLPVAAIAILLMLKAIPASHAGKEGKLFDWPTLFLFMVASASLVTAIHSIVTWIQNAGKLDYLWVSIALISIFLFFWRTLKVDHPLIPIRAFNNRGTLTVLIIGTLGGASIFPITALIPTLLQMSFEVPAWIAGLALVPLVAGVLVSSLTSSRRFSKTGKYHGFYRTGLLIATLSMFAIYLLVDSLGGWAIVIGLACTALGYGLYSGFTITLVQAMSQSKLIGSVTSTIMVSRDVASTVVSTVAGGIFGYSVVHAISKISLPTALRDKSLQPSDIADLSEPLKSLVQSAYLEAFRPIFLNSAISYALILILAYTLPRIELKAK